MQLTAAGAKIQMNLSQYIQTISEYQSPPGLKADDDLDENLQSALRAFVGKILWPNLNGRPDIFFVTSRLAAFVSVAKVRYLTRPNKLTGRLQFEKDIPNSFPILGFSKDWNKLLFTDASLSKVCDCGTRG